MKHVLFAVRLICVGMIAWACYLNMQLRGGLDGLRQTLTAERQRTQEAMDAATRWEAAFNNMESAMKEWERAARRFEGTTNGAMEAMNNWRQVARGWQSVATSRMEAHGIIPTIQGSPLTACQQGQDCRTTWSEKGGRK